ncbi:MAG: hypothetical protein HC849_25500 [Oscillatoriales cyanobacterium RU_3_3]|nr:hypothetical protein [Oscillatoriales cyanobacterium RU_3_3]
MTIGQEFSNNRNFFFLTSLILEINAGTSRLPGFENRISLDLSNQLAGLNLAYFEPENKASKSFGTVQQVEKAFFSMWIFPIAPSANFLTDGVSWGIDRLGTLSMADADVSGLVGTAEIVTSIVPEPIPPLAIPSMNIKLPNQSLPAIRNGNYGNNLARFLEPTNCGCHILSAPSITRCSILCSILFN